MTWLILLIAIPAIIVPIVLLCGFAGCGLDVVGSAEPLGKPSNLHAKLSSNRKAVNLWWLPTGGTADSFEVKRLAPDGTASFANVAVANRTDTDPLLAAGVTFEYTVKAIKEGHTAQTSDPAQVTIPPAAPTLTAVSLNATTNRLTWTASNHATKYRLEHMPDQAVIAQGTAKTADHTIAAGSTHAYRVIAIVENGFDDSIKKDVESDPSATVQVSSAPQTFTPIFTTAGTPPNPTNGQNAAAACIVQRIPAPPASGSTIRIALRGIVGQGTILTAVTISKAAAAGSAQPQDSLDLPRDVKFGGVSGVTIPNGELLTSDPVSYTVVAGQDLHVAFNVSAASGRILKRNVAGAVAYVRNNAADAASQNRPGYNANNNTVFCVETVAVA